MQSYWVWALTIPLYIVNYAYEAKKAKKALVKNHLDRIIGYVWLAFFVSNLVFIATIFIFTIWSRIVDIKLLYLLITPGILTFTGLCMFVNGKVCRFLPYVCGGVVFWLGAVLSALVLLIWPHQSLQFLVLAFCMIGGFILPGHSSGHKAEQDV
jgi:hypothetical protein